MRRDGALSTVDRVSHALAEIDLSSDDPDGKPNCESIYAVGTKVYWDSTNKQATATVSTNKYLGKTTKVAADGDATVRVRLTP